MSELQLVARGIAAAFLDGEWEPASMERRAREAIGGRRGVWLRHLALAAIHGYPVAPLDSPRELAAFLAACQPLVRAYGRLDPPLRIIRRFTPATAMVRRPWPTVPLHTVADVEDLLGLAPTRLRWFADARGLERQVENEALRHYRYRWSAKRAGGARLIEEPKPQLKHIQRVILREVLEHVPVHETAHGFTKGRSALSYASAHVAQRVLLHLDLEDFFGSVGAGRVYGILRQCGYPEEVAHLLTALVTNSVPLAVRRDAPASANPAGTTARRRQLSRLAHPHLPQGAPTSPALANLAAHGVDRRLAGLANRAGLRYTRYADDLAFSSSQALPERQIGSLVSLVEAIAVDEGFRLNEAKTSAQRDGQRQRLAGVVVNRRPNIERREYDLLKAVLHNAGRDGGVSQNREGVADFRAHLRGRIAWVHQLHPGRGERLLTAFEAIDWS